MDKLHFLLSAIITSVNMMQFLTGMCFCAIPKLVLLFLTNTSKQSNGGHVIVGTKSNHLVEPVTRHTFLPVLQLYQSSFILIPSALTSCVAALQAPEPHQDAYSLCLGGLRLHVLCVG